MTKNYEQSEQYLLHKHSTKVQFLNLARNVYQALPYIDTVRRINVHTYINTLEVQITELEATLWPNLNDKNLKSTT